MQKENKLSEKKLFKRLAAFTDIHYGLRHNSRQHNNDCEEFVDWFIEEAKERNCETCIFLGDWHHHRNSINVSTLNYTMRCLRKLNNAFDDVYMIIGNHDLFYKEKRDVHSIIMGEEFENIHLVDEPLIKDDVAIMPWIVGDEWKQIPDIKTKYMFGHFEIPGFRMNAHVEMPDQGTVNRGHFKHQDYVFSGHFHKRQFNGNVHYIGNPFGHNFADADDFDRGAMFLEWGGDPEYVNYNYGPKYIKIYLSDLLEDPEYYMHDKLHAKILVDLDLNYEDVNFIRDTFQSNYNIRDFRLIQEKNLEHTETDYEGNVSLESVDEIVVDQLNNIDSEVYDNKKLIDLYNRL